MCIYVECFVEAEEYLVRSHGRRFARSELSPSVVTIVNSSRVVSDIRRDLGRITGKAGAIQSKLKDILCRVEV